MTSHYVPLTKIPTLVFPTSTQASRHVALMIESLIRQNNSAGRPTVLGLATGSTPVGLYRELIRLHKETGLDFSRVITFNLDEYYPMAPDDPHSYRRWMQETFFNHVNIPPGNIHIPDGTIPLDQVEEYCAQYEQKIRRVGGIDLQILGIGRTGHIGFNEPGSTRHSVTRLVTLDPITRRDAAGSFFGEENVPHQALTMGVGTILEARKIVIMAFGEHKASIVQRTVEGEITDAIAASFLQQHPDTTFLLDEAAASQLTAIRRPWVVGPVKWTPALIRRAVIWLSLKVGKALLKLSDDDFREHELYELLREHGPAHVLGRRVFDDMMATICTHPAGNEPTTVLVFSPHPDDDVISMGGTLIRLVNQGHRVHVAYMTSGNIAVFDHDAWRYADFVVEFNRLFGIDREQTEQVKERVQEFLRSKKPGQPDSPDLLAIKALIRTTEARAAALACGIPPEQLEFMDLRFYRTGTIAKAPIHPQDIADIVTLLQRLRPSQIYVAGELSDPHGTHRMCAEAIFQAVREVRTRGQDFEVWLYRGAWEEWEPHEIERAVPLSPSDLERKKNAIFRHQSQKDRAMFPGGSDTREFWQRAEDRNRETARLYDALGLPEFYALEGFVQWRGGSG
ncbi:MAG: glucosamine-6-phosphate deaminase [Gemmataceae bacterium]|nr:glucosamine-6-phosphate deaminase [Gemmataceae bacterium]MDW8265716.1 glucosamine-6-phosphate deaminase [Gemmataceae bacterium]